MVNQLADSFFSRLQTYLDPAKLGPLLAEFFINMGIAVFILALFYCLWRMVNVVILFRLKHLFNKTTAAFAETLIKFSILSLGVLAALSAAGIQTTAVLASLGVVGLTIGFAARETLSNIISGILIFLDRPFTIDDLVEIDGHYGRVDQITLRSTRIVTQDGRMLAVPNTEVMTKTVVSYTNFPSLRLGIDVTIGVTEEIDRVRKLLITLIQKDADFMTDPAPCVVVTQINDYNIGIELRAWLKDERQHVKKRFDLRETVLKTLTDNNVDMPFETIQLAPHAVTVHGPGPGTDKQGGDG